MKALVMILAISLIAGCAGGMHSGTSSPPKATDPYQTGSFTSNPS